MSLKPLICILVLGCFSWGIRAQQPANNKARLFNMSELSFKAILLQKPPSLTDPIPSSGTAEIIKYKGKYLLCTANHVAITMNGSSQLVLPIEGNKPLVVSLSSLSHRNGWKHHSSADISMIEIYTTSQVSLTILDRASFPIENVLLVPDTIPVNFEVMMMGYPIVDAIGQRFSPLVFETKTSSMYLSAPCKNGTDKNLCDAFYLQTPSFQGLSGGPVIAGIMRSGLQYVNQTWLLGITSGTYSDNTGGKAAKITPTYYLVELLNKY